MSNAELGDMAQPEQPLFGIETSDPGRIIISPAACRCAAETRSSARSAPAAERPTKDQQIAEAGAAALGA